MKEERYVMEKQKKLKFNFVDVIFLLVLLAGVAFVALRLIGPSFSSDPGSSGSDAPEEAEYLITFYVSDSANYVVDHLRKDSPVTDDSITYDLGTLVDYKIGPARISSAAADGHMVLSELEGHSSVYLMCRALGTDNGFGVTVDGLKLEIGHSMVVRTKETKLWAYVYDIQKLEDTPYAD